MRLSDPLSPHSSRVRRTTGPKRSRTRQRKFPDNHQRPALAVAGSDSVARPDEFLVLSSPFVALSYAADRWSSVYFGDISPYRLPLPPPPSFGIIEFQPKTLQIFEFKGLIWKIFRSKDLAVKFSRRLLGSRSRFRTVPATIVAHDGIDVCDGRHACL